MVHRLTTFMLRGSQASSGPLHYCYFGMQSVPEMQSLNPFNHHTIIDIGKPRKTTPSPFKCNAVTLSVSNWLHHISHTFSYFVILP